MLILHYLLIKKEITSYSTEPRKNMSKCMDFCYVQEIHLRNTENN